MIPALLAALVALLASAARPKVTISGKVLGASGEHPVQVALWKEDGFLDRPARQIRIDPGADPGFSFEVRPGRWALSAFEDRNENGRLDMGLFGPSEPSGFWHPFHGWHKPKFEEVAAQVDQDTAGVELRLQ